MEHVGGAQSETTSSNRSRTTNAPRKQGDSSTASGGKMERRFAGYFFSQLSAARMRELQAAVMRTAHKQPCHPSHNNEGGQIPAKLLSGRTVTHFSAPPQRRNSNLLVTLSAAAKSGFFSFTFTHTWHPCSGVCVCESDLQIGLFAVFFSCCYHL